MESARYGLEVYGCRAVEFTECFMRIFRALNGCLLFVLAARVSSFGQICAAEGIVASGDQDSAAVKLISDYKKWKKANAEPQLMNSYLAMLCTTPTPSRLKLEKLDPHKGKYVTVFVNDTGYQEFISKKTPHFAEGTVLVKEKLAAATDTNPELLTVMLKRKAGFDPKNGDWEYLAFNGQGSTVTARGKLQSCQECHESRQAEDYVFRNYLSPEVWKQLR